MAYDEKTGLKDEERAVITALTSGDYFLNKNNWGLHASTIITRMAFDRKIAWDCAQRGADRIKELTALIRKERKERGLKVCKHESCLNEPTTVYRGSPVCECDWDYYMQIEMDARESSREGSDEN